MDAANPKTSTGTGPRLKQRVQAARHTAHSIGWHLWYLFHAVRLQHTVAVRDPDYARYLRWQLLRSSRKSSVPLPQRAGYLIEQVAAAISAPQSSVLCVGCRNSAELDAFRSRGVQRVVGIDLYSTHKDIQVMDMHAMTFPSNSFDVLYSAHSLEHALHPEHAAREFVRVVRPGGLIAIEVPADYSPRGADLVDFGSPEQVQQLFGAAVGQVVLAEQTTLPNVQASQLEPQVIRLVFRVDKD